MNDNSDVNNEDEFETMKEDQQEEIEESTSTSSSTSAGAAAAATNTNKKTNDDHVDPDPADPVNNESDSKDDPDDEEEEESPVNAVNVYADIDIDINNNNNNNNATTNDNDDSDTDVKANNANNANTNQDPAPTPTPIIQRQPPKRPRTAYFIFMASKRTQVVQAQTEKTSIGSIAKIIGQLWNDLPLGEKQSYQDIAAREKVQYKLDLQLYNEQHAHDDDDNNGDNGDNDNKGDNNGDDMGVLAFPLARIRKICRLDPEVKGISKEAAILVTRAAELFTARLGQDTFQMAQMQKKRKTLLVQDVVDVAQLKDTFYFLKDDLGDLIQRHQHQQDGTSTGDGTGTARNGKHEKELSAKAAAAVANTKPLTSFFAVKK
mmetsp:Transcript_18919/g.28040  ORF Transcript_18919/g.28040 Transcript_18919/m.28040 type:complete len:376 (-) Transcript_18919:32-1159(-)